METGNERIDQLLHHAEEYVNTQKQIGKLMITKKGAEIFSAAASALMLSVIFFFVVLFASLTFAWAVSAWFGNPYAGFIGLTVLYLLAGVLLSVKREQWLKAPLKNLFIRSALKNDPHE